MQTLEQVKRIKQLGADRLLHVQLTLDAGQAGAVVAQIVGCVAAARLEVHEVVQDVLDLFGRHQDGAGWWGEDQSAAG